MSSGAKHITLNVGELVEFSARTGDLSNAARGPSSIEGIRGHQKIQKQRDASWHKEYILKQDFSYNSYIFTLNGRIDLLSVDMINPIVEEIKTSYFPVEKLSASKIQLHWAQAKTYAYLYCLEKQNIDSVDVRITWLNIRNQQQSTQNQIFSRRTLTTFVHQLLDTYLQWHREYWRLRKESHMSARQLPFPFTKYRKGQYELAKSVYHVIKHKKSLLVEAPTGIGKTISTLYPAIKSLGEGLAQQIVYLTQKGPAKAIVENTVQTLIKHDLSMLSVTIQAKAKTCPCEDIDTSTSCRNEEGECTRTLGFFDRLPKARTACLATRHLNPSAIREIADNFHICPFELSLEMAKWAQLVVCDVNYVFDPHIHLTHFDQNPSQRVFLLDEVHNLPDRGRDMYSAQLSTSLLRTAANRIKAQQPKLKKLIDTLVKALLSLNGSENLSHPPSIIKNHVDDCLDYLHHEWTQTDNSRVQHRDPLMQELTQTLFRFHVISERFSNAHMCIVKTEDNHITLLLYCIDASQFFTEYHKCARSSVGFSATISPLNFFQKHIGLAEDSLTYAIDSVFPQKNQLTLVCPFIDTRWKHRKQSLPMLAQFILDTCQIHPGKYLVFFPSYAYMDSVAEAIQAHPTGLAVIRQTRQSDEDERKKFLHHFFKADTPVLGFAILGGIFAEGIDFAGDALSGVIIVGAGMPQPTIEKEHMASYFQQQGLDSFQCVYQIPGMVRVAQTGGRVIRCESDRGMVLLVDPRFASSSLQKLMPRHWQISLCNNPDHAGEKITEFWHDESVL